MENYNNNNLEELKKDAFDMGLRGYQNLKKQALIERLNKGKQYSDYDKDVLLQKVIKKGLTGNDGTSKKTLIRKLENPKLEDFNEKRLRKKAEDEGIRLQNVMSRNQIIKRIKNPFPHYTKESLQRLAEDKNIEFDKNLIIKLNYLEY